MQQTILLTYLFVLFTLVSSQGNEIIQPDCVTPVNSLGKCVPSRFCVSIMTALINNDHLTNPNVAKFLREVQCGVKANSHKVCCDVNDIDFGNESEQEIDVRSTPQLASTLQPPHQPHNRSLSIENCGQLNGDETPLKWIAELWYEVAELSRIKPELKCLGTLISPRHVITPAHCVANLPENTTLDFIEVQGHEFSASKIFIHASYNKPKFANDIAIIELDRETATDERINDAVCLPESPLNGNENDRKSTIAIVKRANSSFKFGKALLTSQTECSTYFNQQLTVLTPGQFCANVQSNDSAYSLFIGAIAIESDAKRIYTFKGFTSTEIRTVQAFDESKPYIFTDIAHHLNWIRSAIGDDLKRKEVNLQADAALLDSPTCVLSSGDGFCVKLNQCSLYRDAPKPLSRKLEAYLDQIKCFTTVASNIISLSEDGVCCPKKYIELNSTEQLGVDPRFRSKRGVELLNVTTCGKVEQSRRIVGGNKAEIKEFPWIGLIKYQTGRIFKFTCGASLISNKYVLTCAHCITKLPAGYEIVAVRLGEYDRSTDPDCKLVDENQQECNPPVQDIAVGSLIPHPKYNTPRYANDIGLVRLATEPDMSQGIIPICLPINDEMQQTITEKYTVAGFGFTENGRDSDLLLKVVLPKVSKETCQSFHSSTIRLSEGHECYGGEGIRDSCKGDSGNALMNYVNLRGRTKAVQFGIVTAGHSECGRGARGFPGVYTDINFYMEWILNNMQE